MNCVHVHLGLKVMFAGGATAIRLFINTYNWNHHCSYMDLHALLVTWNRTDAFTFRRARRSFQRRHPPEVCLPMTLVMSVFASRNWTKSRDQSSPLNLCHIPVVLYETNVRM